MSSYQTSPLSLSIKPPHTIDETILNQTVTHYRGSKYPGLARKERDVYRNLRPHLDVAIQSAVRLSPING
jgi:hypothetical protein